MLLAAATSLSAQNTPVSQMEKLTRGVVVVPAKAGGTKNFISWRAFGTDDDNTSFDILRNGEVIAKDIKDKTNYVDNDGQANSEYQIVTRQAGEVTETSDPVKRWNNIYMKLKLNRPAGGTTPKGEEYTYSPNDCSAADVDGDGNYEIIVKWDPSNSKDNSQSGYTGNVYLDCYKLDGTQLWRIDLGKNIRAGAHYTQFLAYDFDGDGKAELVCKTATGSIDGQGNYVNQAADDATIKAADNNKDWRNSSGKVTGGQEYLTVFNGETGAAIHTIFYNPNRNTGVGGDAGWTFNWDDRSGKTDKEYGNRGERYLACVAYLDGADKNPSAVMGRGYYTYAFLWAVDFDGKKLKQKWLHASKTKTAVTVTDANGKTTTRTYAKNTAGTTGSRTLYANGNHNLSVADVDGDGCDEIIYGSAAVDNDGSLLYATGLGHGDAMHVGNLIPDRPGYQVFEVHEESPYGWDIHDAATGEILLRSTGTGDNGRGIAADIDAKNRGWEFSSASDRTVRSATTGDAVSTSGSTSLNFRVYWDGDLQDELLDGGKLDKWGGSGTSRVYPISGKNFYDIESSSSCNSTKSTPNLTADLFGDWREEIILWDGSNAEYLNIFTTNEETDFRIPTLMHDHMYRMGVAWENVAYNQPPHVGYYLPDLFKTQYVKVQDGEFEQNITLGDAIATIERKWKNCGTPTLIKATAPDGTVKSSTRNLTLNNFYGINAKRDVITQTILVEGTPTLPGDYSLVFKSGANVADSKTQNDTIRIHVTDVTAIASTEADGQGWVEVASPTFGDQLRLTVNTKDGQKAVVTLLDAVGRTVAKRIVSGTDATINGLGHLSPDVYILRVQAGDQKFTTKVTKQ